jgi:hypothetical protein
VRGAALRTGKEHEMESEFMERRHLEQLIRRAEAEEHLLERRLERLEADRRRTRQAIQSQLGDELWHHFAG